jgi:PTS system mannose-specific IID component
MFMRLFAVQGSWNYETLLGNGIAFALEPALRLLPGGRGGPQYRAALARESGFFNAHPYLASLAVGALARAELSLEPPEQIERFRNACCGPLGSVGDRLVWAGWLPACSLLSLAAFGLGASPLAVILLFLVTYNAGHIALRAWGLRVGYRDGLRVASALGAPLFRRGPAHVARASALVGGIAMPLVIRSVFGIPHDASFGYPQVLLLLLAAAAAGAVVLVRLNGRVEGWRLAVVGLALFILISVVM